MAWGAGPFMADGEQARIRNAAMQRAVKSANIGNARENFKEIAKDEKGMKVLSDHIKNQCANNDKVRIYSKFYLRYLLYLTIIFFAGQ